MKKMIFLLMTFLSSGISHAGNPFNKGTTSTTPKAKETIWSTDSSQCEYKGWAFNSLFNLPVIRYNINSFCGSSTHYGDMEYFNSLGAGFGFSRGVIHISSKKPGDKLRGLFDGQKEVTMKNVWGISFGVLFSKNNNGTNTRAIFAPNVCMQFLDFQIGYGYELGDVDNTAHRSILTLSYGISLSKLLNTGSRLLTAPTDNKNKPITNLKSIF